MCSNPMNSKKIIFILCLMCLILVVTVNCVDEYTRQEKAALEKFRPLVENILYRDYMRENRFLIRWLRAKDLDITKARIMLKKAIKWRKANQIDKILNETILTFDVMPYRHDTISYSGSPVFTLDPTAFEIKKWTLAGKRDKLLRYMVQSLEIAEAQVQYLSKIFPAVRQAIVISDYRRFNQRQQADCFSCVLVVRELLENYINYYPQLVKSLIIINAPRIAERLLKALSFFLSSHSQKGLVIFGQNKTEWSTELFKIIPRNQLIMNLGGTKPDFVPCAAQDFVCKCKIFLGTAGQDTTTNNTVGLSTGFRKLHVNLC